MVVNTLTAVLSIAKGLSIQAHSVGTSIYSGAPTRGRFPQWQMVNRCRLWLTHCLRDQQPRLGRHNWLYDRAGTTGWMTGHTPQRIRRMHAHRPTICPFFRVVLLAEYTVNQHEPLHNDAPIQRTTFPYRFEHLLVLHQRSPCQNPSIHGHTTYVPSMLLRDQSSRFITCLQH